MKTTTKTAKKKKTTNRAAKKRIVKAPRKPFALKKILVPVDFSDCSTKALEYAVPYARQFKCSIILAHIVQIHYGGALYGPLDYPILEEDFQGESDRQLKAVSKKYVAGKVPVKVVSRAGRPATEIATLAKELKADLIILSTHGYTGLSHAWMGSTAEQVVRHAHCPVLTVR